MSSRTWDPATVLLLILCAAAGGCTSAIVCPPDAWMRCQCNSGDPGWRLCYEGNYAGPCDCSGFDPTRIDAGPNE